MTYLFEKTRSLSLGVGTMTKVISELRTASS